MSPEFYVYLDENWLSFRRRFWWGPGKRVRLLWRGVYLEQPQERLRLELEWDRWMRGDELVVLDEAQCWPEVFPKLRGAIDADRGRRGRFLLLGSVAPALMKEVGESLAWGGAGFGAAWVCVS